MGLKLASNYNKAKYVTTACEGCPNPKAPPNIAHKFSFFSLFLEDAQLLSVVASCIPRFFACWKKKNDREKMATSRGVERPFRGPGARNRDERVKRLVTQPGNAPKARPSRLTAADTVNKVWRTHWVLQRMQPLNWDTAIVCLGTYRKMIHAALK